MQPRGPGGEGNSPGPFSILGRIERDATSGAGLHYLTTPTFQYPRSDRAGCNQSLAERMVQSAGPFSILGRIERDATLPGETPALIPTDFQYPRSDRAGCNIAWRDPGPYSH